MINNIVSRSKIALSLDGFNSYNPPMEVFDYDLECPHDDQHILRMKLHGPHEALRIPEELQWCKDLIHRCIQKQVELDVRHSYCYITVRHGIHRSVTEDEWHTDGYSEVLTHIPEQNYIVTSNHTTEYVKMPIKFPNDFNALRHDLVNYIGNCVAKNNPLVHKADPHKVYIFDPYVIHRRPVEAFGKQRTFVRVTFVPIEICDDACTQNPLFEPKTFNRNACSTRDNLKQY